MTLRSPSLAAGNSPSERPRSPIRVAVVVAIVLLATAPAIVFESEPVSAAVAPRASSTANSAGASVTSLTIAKPTGTAEGDLLLAQIGFAGGSGITITPPTGWTLVDRKDSGTSVGQAVYRRIATSAAPNNYTWTFTSTRVSGGIIAYQGVDLGTPVSAFGGQVTASSVTITAPSVTVTYPGARLVAFFTTIASTTFTGGSSSLGAGRYNTPNLVPTVAAADETVNAAGATGTRFATTAAAGNNVGHTILLRVEGIKVRSTATATGTAGLLTLARPSGTTQHDALIATLAFLGGSGTTVTPPSGWTLVQRTNSGTALGQAIYRKTAGSSEGPTYAFTYSPATVHLVGGVAAYVGADASAPVDAANGTAIAAGTTATAPSVTTTRARDTLLGVFSSADGRDLFTLPSGMTQRFAVGSTSKDAAATDLGDEQVAAVGATGTRVATTSRSAIHIASSVALQLPSVAFQASTSTGPEGVGTLNVPVRLTGASSQPVTVNYAVTGGTASATVDYVLAAGTLTFPAGSTSQNIAVTIVDDTAEEGVETLDLALSAPSNTVLGTGTTHTITVPANDVPTSGVTVASWPVATDGTAVQAAWGGWTAAPGSANVSSTNFLKLTNTGETTNPSVVVDFSDIAFLGATDQSYSIPITGNVEFAVWQDSTPSTSAPSEGTFVFQAANADGTVTVTFTGLGNIAYVQYRIVQVPAVLMAQTYAASFTVSEV